MVYKVIDFIKQQPLLIKAPSLMGIIFTLYGLIAIIIPIHFFWESLVIGIELLLFSLLIYLFFQARKITGDKLGYKIGIGLIVFIFLIQLSLSINLSSIKTPVTV